MDGKPHAQALRRGRYSEPGRTYHITTVTRDRTPVFRDFVAARALVTTLRHAQALGHADTLAYVVMPDHLHWLMTLGDGMSLSTVVRSVKAVTARRLGRALWQQGFHDHAVRREEDLASRARYIAANPLRAGLVRNLGDYPHWDAIWL
ncbi:MULTISPECIES: transposase [unclassified Thioalkalivibrio]|uniref:REP-associated tyrosine transposase n=1 Tax=unclassified Thioalkalivibrio TaxID=2621013 RepID=UPI00036B5DC8|nr:MULTISPECIES: transposase [unclassified Thioalkalivibrio]